MGQTALPRSYRTWATWRDETSPGVSARDAVGAFVTQGTVVAPDDDGDGAKEANSLDEVGPLETTVRRIFGESRYETAAEISAATFDPGVDEVWIATGQDFPDALVAGSAAGAADGPVLLTKADTLPEATAAELRRLEPGRIVVVGGTDAVSESVELQLQGFTDGSVDRLKGAHRFETAAAVSAELFPSGNDEVWISTGEDFPDALAGGTAAGRSVAPVLLVNEDGVPQATADELERLDSEPINVLGGSAAVSDAVVAELERITGGDAQRFAGANRYATAVAVSEETSPNGSDVVYVATGAAFADGLAGTPAAVSEDAPMLLLPPDRLPDVVRTELQRLDPSEVVVIGGPGALPDDIVAQLREIAAG